MPELDEKDSAYHQSLIGILQWVVELGCVNICLEVSMMSSHLALLRKGHLDQVLQIFGYSKSTTILSWCTIQVSRRLNFHNWRGETRQLANSDMWWGRKRHRKICQNQEEWVSSYRRKLMWTMHLIQQP